MKAQDRKAALADYKERKVASGIYRISCSASGRQWVGGAPDLATIWNRQSFSLRLGSNPNRSLQVAWTEHGEGSFGFEELERLKEPGSDQWRRSQLRSRRADWCERLGAERI